MTDAQRLQQVLKNLLSNAFKFTERGGVTLTIEPVDPALVRQRMPLGQAPLTTDVPLVAFRVRDTGVGIAPEKVAVVFEAFQQADGTTSASTGGPVSGCRSAARSSRCSAARSTSRARPASAAPSPSTCRAPTANSSRPRPRALRVRVRAAARAAAPTAGDPDPGRRRGPRAAAAPAAGRRSGDAVTKAIGGLLGPDKGVDLTVATSPAQAATMLGGEPLGLRRAQPVAPARAGLDLLDTLREHPRAQLRS